MLKSWKYLKKYWLSIVFIAGLLFAQAQTVLALPDYMSDIVTYGIQAGGLDSNVPEIVSKDSLEHATIFMSEEDAQYVLKRYDLIKFDKIKNEELPYKIDLSKKSKVVGSGIYVLKDISNKEHGKLSKKLETPMLVSGGIQSAVAGEKSAGSEEQQKKMKEMLAQVPAGVDVFDAMKMMPKEDIQKLIDESSKGFEALGQSTVDIAGALSVKVEYTALGIDTGSIQNNYILNTGLWMMVVALGGALAAIIVGYLASRTAAGVSRSMRKDVFDKVESFSNTEFDKFSTASLITRTTNDITQVQNALVMILRMVIYAPILGVGAILRVLDSANSMVWIIVLVVVVILVLIIVTLGVLGPNFKKIQGMVDRLNLLVRESLSGIMVIRAFRTEKIETKRFDDANAEMTRVNLFIARTFSLMMPIIMFIMNAASLLIIWVGSHQIDLGNMQVGNMMAFMQYSMQIIMAFMMLVMVSFPLPRANVAAKRIFEILETKLSIADPKEPVAFNEKQRGYVEFKDVSFRYPGAEEDVLTNISFTAKPEQTTAFIGSTGSGKSTIINLVPRFFDVSDGSIEVNGIDIRGVRQKDLRERIGLVPQKGVLFSGTIESNIKYSDEKMSEEQMLEASRIAQAEEFVSEKEEGYASIIAQGGTNVSGGQKQRISIARAIAKEPEIFIFDDSFSALDFKTDALVRKAVDELCKKTKSTVLLVAQRVSSIMNADQIIVLEEGKIVGKGTHKELLESCEVYKEIAYSQLSKEELENE